MLESKMRIACVAAFVGAVSLASSPKAEAGLVGPILADYAILGAATVGSVSTPSYQENVLPQGVPSDSKLFSGPFSSEALVTGGFGPTVSAQAYSDGTSAGLTSAGASAELIYYVLVNGPAADFGNPVFGIVDGNYSFTASAFGGGPNGSWSTFSQGSMNVSCSANCPVVGTSLFSINYNPAPSSTFPSLTASYHQVINLTVGSAYMVDLFVVAGVFSTDPTQSLSAISDMDPMFSIDPSTPDATDYSFSYSAGLLDNTSATPLPAALPLFVGGLGIIGVLGRRSKRRASAATVTA